MTSHSTPYYREEDNELLGYIAKDTTSWVAETVFGYTIARTTTEQEAKDILLEKGLGYLLGIWLYYDKDEQDWFPCVISEAYKNKVIVIRTNEAGYQEPDLYKYVVIEHPTENTLIKAS